MLLLDQLSWPVFAISLHRNYILLSKRFDRLALRRRVQQPVLLFLLGSPILCFRRLASQQVLGSLIQQPVQQILLEGLLLVQPYLQGPVVRRVVV